MLDQNLMECSSMVEHLAVNQAVVGSSPTTPAIFTLVAQLVES